MLNMLGRFIPIYAGAVSIGCVITVDLHTNMVVSCMYKLCVYE